MLAYDWLRIVERAHQHLDVVRVSDVGQHHDGVPLQSARFIGEPLKAMRKLSSSIAIISRASARASFPLITSRAANAGSFNA